MTGPIDVTDNMIRAAKLTGVFPPTVKDEDIARALKAAMHVMPGLCGPKYGLRVRGTLGMVKARFMGVTERPAYFTVETEDGKTLTVHANDFQPTRGPTR